MSASLLKSESGEKSHFFPLRTTENKHNPLIFFFFFFKFPYSVISSRQLSGWRKKSGKENIFHLRPLASALGPSSDTLGHV